MADCRFLVIVSGYSNESLQDFEGEEKGGQPNVGGAQRMLTAWFSAQPVGANSLSTLITALERVPGAGNLCRLLKDTSLCNNPPTSC